MTRRQPWHPNLIFMISALLSPLIGGVFHALNYGRLGAPERVRAAALQNAAIGFVVLGVALEPSIDLLVLAWVGVAVGAYFRWSQIRLFREHRFGGGGVASWRRAAGVSLLLTPLVFLVGLGSEWALIQFRYALFDHYYESGDYEAAKPIMIRELEIAPDDPSPHWNLAQVYLETGEVDLLLEHLRAYVRAVPEDVEAEEWLLEIEKWVASQDSLGGR